MIEKHLKRLVLSVSLFTCINATAEHFPKVILSGDYPDPTILRDGEDYYMTHSPFYYKPGFLVWHSKDLINWEPITRILPEYKGSAMAPDLVKHDGKFYLYFPSAGTNWVTYADHITGPWSEPVDLKIPGIDPGHIVDENGKRYLFVNEGKVTPLTDDGLSKKGDLSCVYDGWAYPKHWKTEGMYLESPKLNFKDGYYYMTSAQGGTAGPATSHMVVTARSKSINGPWENSPYNPVVHTYCPSENWWSKGHGTIIDDVDGNWWIVYHAYANGYHTLGRQTLIEPIEWTSNGWYRSSPQTKREISEKKAKANLSISDNFKDDKLGFQWTFWKENTPSEISIKNNALYMNAKGDSPADARLLLTTASDKTYETSVTVKSGSKNRSGLMLYYNEKAFAGVVADSKQITIYKDADNQISVKNIFGKDITLKIVNKGNKCSFLASKNGQEWSVLADNIDVSSMHHNNYGGFFALRPALISMGEGKGEFRNFTYSNLLPTEDDMSAYIMIFHKDDTHGLHFALSNDGYSFTALNEGNPVISGDTISDQKGIRDPHITRGHDGAFYMAMTDLHVFGQRDGKRDTEWERDGKKYGWGNNRGLVLMKSWDLINWTRTNIRFDEMSKKYSEIGCAWAPETIYDEEKGKMMIYFTMRFGTEANRLYYTYVNDEFTKLETDPELLFNYPDKTISAIDADITKINGKYRMFYVSHDGGSGIKQAVSDRINGEFEFDPRWYDPEKHACEAPNLWKRIGEDKWVLMYDCYGQKVHNFGFIETSDFENFDILGQFNNGVMKTTNYQSPKHGAVIQITKAEAEKLAKHWGLKMEFKTPNEFRINIK